MILKKPVLFLSLLSVSILIFGKKKPCVDRSTHRLIFTRCRWNLAVKKRREKKISSQWSQVNHTAFSSVLPYVFCIRVAQNAPKVKNLQGDLFHSCFFPSWWEKCIETPKKLMARGRTRLRRFQPHLPYGYQEKMTDFGRGHFWPLQLPGKHEQTSGNNFAYPNAPPGTQKAPK